ncbi:1-hydroxy-2-methyl-2-butenyl 4-diphosphate reductase [Streptomyces sp. RKND-216]|uniref:phosphorylase family protein n=1 Tax=Streptomyces sp. RKND-216 TaxID=2562581 RepID=UPI001FF8A421|nr:1-hydroxy-2-methyl-2-butenyl 4-diphosphate reductase [Streptomyces sp. RKND-216]
MPAPPPGAGTRLPAAAPLLVACALGVERFALTRRTGTAVGPGPVTVLRTGMGPAAARGALARALRDEPVPGGTAVVAAGFCAGLLPGMRPGDLVLADETRDAAGRTPCTGNTPLARALAELGTVHTGPIAGSDHVVRGGRRAALRRTGAVAVDMESAASLGAAVRGARDRPVTAVRVVVDAPGHELLRIGTLRGGISAFRVLCTLLPALLAWHRSLPLSRR